MFGEIDPLEQARVNLEVDERIEFWSADERCA
jgi:hypothetical protein